MVRIMLRKCSKDEFKQYADFAYQLATNKEKSSYPTYCDGIKTKEMFLNGTNKAFERDNEEVLLFIQDGKVEGLIHYYWLSEDKYVGINSFNINNFTKTAISEFLSLLKTRFLGYELYMGFPVDNNLAIDFFNSHGYECIEDDYNNIAYLEEIDNIKDSTNLIHINEANYDKFKMLHDQIDGDMYWNSERIFADLKNWNIYVYEKDDSLIAAIYYMDEKDDWYEIFGIDMNNNKFNHEAFKTLLNKVLLDVKNNGGKILSFFCEESYEKETLECGFTKIGRYLCYKICLS